MGILPVMTNLRKEPETIDWSLTTWKGSRLRQHREFLALPFRRKMELLEEMTQRLPNKQDSFALQERLSRMKRIR